MCDDGPVEEDDSELQMSERQEQVLARSGDLEVGEDTKRRVAEALDEDKEVDDADE